MAKTSIVASKTLLLIFSCFCAYYSLAANTLYQGGEALNSSSILVSKNGLFSLGFVNIGSDVLNSSYLGIWYNNGTNFDKTHPFWLANRDKPIADNSGVLAIDRSGNMKLTHFLGDLVGFYSSQSSTTNLTAVLEDSGNFVLKDANSDSDQILWQSFDYPTDTFLPGMRLGINHRTNKTSSLTAWLSEVVPASGAFTFEWQPNGQELVIKRRGEIYWTSGSLTSNDTFENFFSLNSGLIYSFLNVSEADEDYFTFMAAQVEVGPQYEKQFPKWKLQFDGSIIDQSDGRNFGGIYCDGNSAEMGCERWDVGPDCDRVKGKKYELFSGYFGNTVPKTIDHNASLSIIDCIDICWKNCSCVGVGSRGSDYANGTGCIFWYGSFTAEPSGTVGGRYYIINQGTKPGHDAKEESWVWILAAVAVVLIMALAGILLYLRRRRLRGAEKFLHELMTSDAANDTRELENDGNIGHNLKVYSAATIMAATNNFASENKLGQGGFGPVYKGKLPDGRETAVKRLSRSSGQGLVEFKNELILIAKLQHMNLVRLLGCCIQGEERMLVYEYMPNKSLDSFIFDQSKRELLDWKKRFEIIEGIAQGLIYLHKHSRLRIIHRDLKAGNILLDENLNPKISDFGMARIFKINELEGNTNRVVGTYGYMSPEYAMEGVFSVKSDVFSFGVLVLEIVSGRKIHGLLQMDGRHLNLVGYAWDLWKAGTPFELVDPILRESCSRDQVLRCINVGLLCVEHRALDRPTMSDIISMLTSEARLPLPKQPAFSNARTVLDDAESSLSNLESSSRNHLSNSSMSGR